MPFITWHYPVFKCLSVPWRWNVVLGTARNVNCTGWCNEIPPSLSDDGTDLYLDRLSEFDSRVRVFKSAVWSGKVAMCNAPMPHLRERSILFQIDADEIWTATQIKRVVDLFESNPMKNCAYFWCRYFVGPKIVITSRETYGNRSSYEWHRAWRYEPGMEWETHEPPKIHGFEERPMTHQETEKAGCVFDHYAYATEAAMRFKERYYPSCKGQLDAWKTLQENVKWPVTDLSIFLRWVGSGVTADRMV